MITSLRLLRFKNFKRESLRVGSFTVIVGANASGKSNIRDAFRFLRGIGLGYTLAEIIGGKHIGGQLEWIPIRGAPHEIARFGTTAFGLGAALTLEGRHTDFTLILGSEVLGARGFKVGHEELIVDDKTLYSAEGATLNQSSRNIYHSFEPFLRSDQPILTQIHGRLSGTALEDSLEPVSNAFSSIQFLDLVPELMKQPSYPGHTSLGDGGVHLPAVLKALCDDPEKKAVLTQWVRELTPMDVTDFKFPGGPDGKVHLVLRERSGREVSAQSASDGTLRFLAMLAALLAPNPASLYFFEEIDNGIHPSRLNLLIDLIEQQTAKGTTQVIATTHSPQLLSMISDSTFENTSVVCRLEDTEDAIIRPVADLPNAIELRESQGLGRLLAGGWMETALAFTEKERNDGEHTE